jgi:UDP-glucose 4-epimerase
MTILVEGGAGYIGSHTCVELFKEGHDIVIIDNLVNAYRDVIEKIEFITQKKFIFMKHG